MRTCNVGVQSVREKCVGEVGQAVGMRRGGGPHLSERLLPGAKVTASVRKPFKLALHT